MRTLSRRIGCLLVCCLAVLVLLQPSQTAAQSWVRWVYYVPDDPRSYASLVAHKNAIDVVAPDAWRIQGDGTIAIRTSPALIQTMQSWGLQVMPMVQKYDWSDHMHGFLNNRGLWTKTAAQLAALVVQNNVPGIHLDIENIDHSDGQALTSFIAEVAYQVRQKGRQVTLALPAKAVGEPDWYPEYDYDALGKLADLVVVMAYDHGYALGTPEAVAPIPWFRNVIDYTARYMPRSKVIMGMPWYGYDWNTSRGGMASYVSYTEASAWGGPRRGYDVRSQAPYTWYWYSGSHVVWYEDVWSVQAKLSTVTVSGVRGWAAWRLGYEDPRVWWLLTPRR